MPFVLCGRRLTVLLFQFDMHHAGTIEVEAQIHTTGFHALDLGLRCLPLCQFDSFKPDLEVDIPPPQLADDGRLDSGLIPADVGVIPFMLNECRD